MGRIAVNTVICASSSAIVSVATSMWKERCMEPYSAVNGIVAGIPILLLGIFPCVLEDSLCDGQCWMVDESRCS